MSDIPSYQFKAESLISSKRISKEKLDEIGQWVRTNRELPEMPEEQLALFLMACDDDIEFAKNTVKSYFMYQTQAPTLFGYKDVDSEELQQVHRVSKYAVIPRRTKDNYAVAVVQLKDPHWLSHIMEPQMKTIIMCIESMFHKDPPNGFIYVFNLKNVGLMHLTRVKLSVSRKFFCFIQEGLPAKLRKVHILNTSYIFEKFISICRPFIKNEVLNIVLMHPSSTPMEEFFEKHVEAECMPSDYGGLQPDMETLSAQLQEDMRKLKPFYEQCERQVEAYKKLCTL